MASELQLGEEIVFVRHKMLYKNRWSQVERFRNQRRGFSNKSIYV